MKKERTSKQKKTSSTHQPAKLLVNKPEPSPSPVKEVAYPKEPSKKDEKHFMKEILKKVSHEITNFEGVVITTRLVADTLLDYSNCFEAGSLYERSFQGLSSVRYLTEELEATWCVYLQENFLSSIKRNVDSALQSMSTTPTDSQKLMIEKIRCDMIETYASYMTAYEHYLSTTLDSIKKLRPQIHSYKLEANRRKNEIIIEDDPNLKSTKKKTLFLKQAKNKHTSSLPVGPIVSPRQESHSSEPVEKKPVPPLGFNSLPPNESFERKETQKKVFGVELKDSIEAPHLVPEFILQSILLLDMSGLSQLGLFRVAGDRKKVLEVISSFEKGVELNEDIHHHVLCTLVKKYLRELPNPVIPFHKFDELLSLQALPEPDKVPALKAFVESLPPENSTLLEFITSFLLRIAAKSDLNQMTPNSLASLLTPNLMYRKENDLSRLMADTTAANCIFEFILQHASLIFQNVKKQQPLSADRELSTRLRGMSNPELPLIPVVTQNLPKEKETPQPQQAPPTENENTKKEPQGTLPEPPPKDPPPPAEEPPKPGEEKQPKEGDFLKKRRERPTDAEGEARGLTMGTKRRSSPYRSKSGRYSHRKTASVGGFDNLDWEAGGEVSIWKSEPTSHLLDKVKILCFYIEKLSGKLSDTNEMWVPAGQEKVDKLLTALQNGGTIEELKLEVPVFVSLLKQILNCISPIFNLENIKISMNYINLTTNILQELNTLPAFKTEVMESFCFFFYSFAKKRVNVTDEIFKISNYFASALLGIPRDSIHESHQTKIIQAMISFHSFIFLDLSKYNKPESSRRYRTTDSSANHTPRSLANYKIRRMQNSSTPDLTPTSSPIGPSRPLDLPDYFKFHHTSSRRSLELLLFTDDATDSQNVSPKPKSFDAHTHHHGRDYASHSVSMIGVHLGGPPSLDDSMQTSGKVSSELTLDSSDASGIDQIAASIDSLQMDTLNPSGTDPPQPAPPLIDTSTQAKLPPILSTTLSPNSTPPTSTPNVIPPLGAPQTNVPPTDIQHNSSDPIPSNPAANPQTPQKVISPLPTSPETSSFQTQLESSSNPSIPKIPLEEQEPHSVTDENDLQQKLLNIEKMIKKNTKALNSLMSEKRLLQVEISKFTTHPKRTPTSTAPASLNTKKAFEFWANYNMN